jgi:hypothetical protein
MNQYAIFIEGSGPRLGPKRIYRGVQRGTIRTLSPCLDPYGTKGKHYNDDVSGIQNPCPGSYKVVGSNPTYPVEHLGDKERTNQGHSSVSSLASEGCRGQLGTSSEHSNDASANSSCCTYVALGDSADDLAFLAQAWRKLPSFIRQTIVTLVRSVVTSED